MPNCIKLTRKGEDEATDLTTIDTELWNHFVDTGEPEGNEQWYHNWYNTIGLAYAMGKSTMEVMDLLDGPDLKEVAKYLHENYNVEAWFEHK